MKHIILTRFNVSMPGWNQKLNLSDSWLEERFKLFESMCLPSVASQHNQNFTWLVMFDKNTPNKYKEKIKALKKRYDFEAYFMGVFHLEDVVKQILKSHQGVANTLLTTRLDSDDIIATGFIEYLQQSAEKGLPLEHRKVFNFDRGAILYSKKQQYALYEYVDQSNAFTSLLEPFDEKISTILAVKHTELMSFASMQSINMAPMWLQVVHGGNVSNRIKGTRVYLNTHAKAFPYLQAIDVTETNFEILLDKYGLSIFRGVRETLRLVVKKIYYMFK